MGVGSVVGTGVGNVVGIVVGTGVGTVVGTIVWIVIGTGVGSVVGTGVTSPTTIPADTGMEQTAQSIRIIIIMKHLLFTLSLPVL